MYEQLNLMEALRPVARMVAEELHALLLADRAKEQPERKASRRLRGIEGIKTIFQCGEWKARKLRASGILDAAITELPGGRTFLVDEDKALEAMARWRKNQGRIAR